MTTANEAWSIEISPKDAPDTVRHEHELIELAASLQQGSEHPLARAVKQADLDDNTDPARTALLDEDTRARITALARPSNVDPAVFDDPSAWWDAAPIADRRSLVRELVAVRILPAGRGRRTFDPETVEVTPLW